MPASPIRSLAILGPAGSFSEVAALRHIAEAAPNATMRHYPNIVRAFEAIGRHCDQGIIPIENMVEGYVPLSLDLLAESDLQIVGEIIIPVNFSFVANCQSLAELERIHVQFVTEGQCREFLSSLPDQTKLITTESNSASFEAVRRRTAGEGAIIPQHLLAPGDFPLAIPQVNDRQGNQTRFIVLETAGGQRHTQPGNYRTSIVIRELADAPGALYAIIGALARRNLNLSCIMSRPNKIELGRYFFFIDIEAPWPENPELVAAITEIEANNLVKILGSYPIAGTNPT